ncbi:MAG: hypothetical protein M3O09_14845 [Acidobacteriota bacterium]|nr:hypothetical protein [Acidobacteriota bacterium]
MLSSTVKIKRVQLTSSPLVLSNPTLSRDGKKLFVVGYDQRGELMRFDMKSRQFMPFLGGISAEFACVSPDGQWVTYVLYPEETLWRSKLDGTERLQLTNEPAEAVCRSGLLTARTSWFRYIPIPVRLRYLSSRAMTGRNKHCSPMIRSFN